ncbi:hypothetical protein ASG33_23845 [Dyadobacter sp. Leaf189]|nr:hypothetical protein ASG33_23845 [Dyadobacter sp. Leaf189]
MKKLIKTCFAILVYSQFSSYSAAQDLAQKPPKWEVGVDLHSLLFDRRERAIMSSGYSLIIKRQFQENALRFRPNFALEYMPNPSVKGTNQPRSYDLSFDLGYERQRKSRRFVHYYGVDFRLKFIKVNSTVGIGLNDSTSTFTQEKGHTSGIGIAPFIGGKYFITDRIAISLETRCMLSYLRVRSSTQQVNIDNQPVSPKLDAANTNGVNFDIHPISAIFISYTF